MTKIIIYTDGGARGNPGIAGAGTVIKNEKEEILKNVSKALGTKTNNEAEYEAVILGLTSLKHLLGADKLKNIEIEIRMDSQLVCKQLKGEYKIKEEKLFPYFIKVWNMRVKTIPHISFTYIPREKNKEADALANIAMDGQSAQTLL